MADNGEYARYQYRLQQAQIAKDAAARAAARDTGTNSPVRTFAQTQSTSNYETGFEGSVKQAPVVEDATGGAGQVAIAPTSAGVGATDDGTAMGDTTPNPDESYGGATQEEQDAINKAQQGVVSGAAGTNTRRQIIPQGNILDRFASYTYRASVYLMSPEQYQQLIRSKKKSINGYNLLFQSGGAPKNVGGLGAPTAQTFFENDGTSSTTGYDAGRNPSFPLDFYIDSLTVKHITQGQGTGAAHAVTTMNFTVIEPMGITLVDRLYAAVQDHAPKEEGTGKINYSTAQYLMVLRWYGYDINGNLIKGGPTLSDPNAVIEKFIPFAINSIQWSVNNKLVNYDFSCTAQGQYVGGGTRRGTVPYDIQLSGSTVSEILGGGAILPQASTAATPGATTTSVSSAQAERDDAAAVDAANTSDPPPKANAAKNPSSKSNIGLMGIMNDHVYQLTTGARPIYQYPDEYEIVFIGAAKQLIGDATVVLPGAKKEANQTPMGPSQTKDTSGASPDTDQKNTTMKTIPAVAGQPIVQIIDQVIRNSSYITSQQLTQRNWDTNDLEPNPAAANKPVNWYSIHFEAIPLKPDNLRNDYSYKIRYIISVYKIDKYDSKYFPIGNFRGVHKSYPWWFTGKNTAVLEYNEALNTSYNMLVSGSNTLDSGTETIRRQYAATLEDMVIYTYGPTSSESMQGSKERGNEASANIADSLYGGADLANANLKIIGDPAWIQQGSISGGITAAELDLGSFLPDGTINFDAEQTYFEVRWNRPDDYDLSTGMAVPTSKTNKTKSRVFQVTEISSEFKQGKFEQTIVGSLFNIPKPDGSNKAPDASLPKFDSGSYGDSWDTPTTDSRVAATQSTMPVAPQVNANPSNNSSQNSNVPALNVVSRNDGVPQPAPAPQPATSGSGENLDVGDPFVPPGALSGRITADGLGNSPSTPQIISRDY